MHFYFHLEKHLCSILHLHGTFTWPAGTWQRHMEHKNESGKSISLKLEGTPLPLPWEPCVPRVRNRGLCCPKWSPPLPGRYWSWSGHYARLKSISSEWAAGSGWWSTDGDEEEKAEEKKVITDLSQHWKGHLIFCNFNTSVLVESYYITEQIWRDLMIF